MVGNTPLHIGASSISFIGELLYVSLVWVRNIDIFSHKKNHAQLLHDKNIHVVRPHKHINNCLNVRQERELAKHSDITRLKIWVVILPILYVWVIMYTLVCVGYMNAYLYTKIVLIGQK